MNKMIIYILSVTTSFLYVSYTFVDVSILEFWDNYYNEILESYKLSSNGLLLSSLEDLIYLINASAEIYKDSFEFMTNLLELLYLLESTEYSTSIYAVYGDFVTNGKGKEYMVNQSNLHVLKSYCDLLNELNEG